MPYTVDEVLDMFEIELQESASDKAALKEILSSEKQLILLQLLQENGTDEHMNRHTSLVHKYKVRDEKFVPPAPAGMR